MPKLFRKTIAGLALLAIAAWAPTAYGADQNSGQTDFKLGEHYVELSKPYVKISKSAQHKIETVLFLWYNCPSCYRLDTDINQWVENLPDDVEFIRLPAIFGHPAVDLHARIFMTLEILGADNTVHVKVFDLFQRQKQVVNAVAELPSLAQKLGFDPDKFVETFNSPAVDAEMERVQKLIDIYRVNVVPTIIINGKYAYDSGMVGGVPNFTDLADILIEKERQAANPAQ
ncbi:MAG: thiol:disulfide interchange protein DsbA/DsbL [Candidatus Adiutrix sp.]|nr:thiol:disulfide interchange protein DsbA/DsbL [Candidatus Adiutrix sp.]